MPKKVMVLDSTSLIMGLNPQTAQAKAYTTPSILGELRSGELSKLRVESSIASGAMYVRTPTLRFKRRIEEVCMSLGEQAELSEADKDLLALAEELNAEGLEPIIITDDFAVQNVAEYLNLEYRSLATKGISKLLGWAIYCPACHRKLDNPTLKICETCGTRLKRKPIKSRAVKHKV
ncbi:MAG: hypothetical protein QXO32_02120 [Candidatus Bathyarchaeia archaeon]